jgi:endoribonuclease Dicer
VPEQALIMSPKVQMLLQLLNEIYGEAERQGLPTPVVLLFCERRVTAYLLLSLISEICKDEMHPHIRASIFIGQGGADDAGVSMLIQRQVLVVDQFRRGELNLLFATSVAEEGIDIPACNYVIRFDIFSNVAQYIQSRGRARHPGSRFILFLENGAAKAEQALLDVKAAEARIREVCSQLPEGRVVSGTLNDAQMEIDDQDDEASLVARNFEGQAKALPEFAALNVVSAFCESLGTNDFVIMAPTYKINGSGTVWQATCQLPSICGIPPATGFERTSQCLDR